MEDSATREGTAVEATVIYLDSFRRTCQKKRKALLAREESLDDRIEKIKASISRINALMVELRSMNGGTNT